MLCVCKIVTVVLWSQTLPSGEEGHQTTVGKASANKLLNRFRNITACESTCVVCLKGLSIDLCCLCLFCFLFWDRWWSSCCPEVHFWRCGLWTWLHQCCLCRCKLPTCKYVWWNYGHRSNKLCTITSDTQGYSQSKRYIATQGELHIGLTLAPVMRLWMFWDCDYIYY